MTIDAYDGVALPHFEDRLSEELAHLHAGRRESPVPGRDGSGSGPRRWRPSRRLVVAGVGAAAAAATLLAGFGLLPSTESEPAEASLAERIMRATDDALADSVVHVETDFTSFPDEAYWYDSTSGAFRRRLLDDSGNPLHDYGRPTAPSPDERVPDPLPQYPSNCQPIPGEEGCVEPRPDPERFPSQDEIIVSYCNRQYLESWSPYTEHGDGPEDIRNRVADGRLVEDGTETVDGRELIRLRDVETAELPEDFAIEQFVLVDPETYRPIRLYGDRGGPEEFEMTFDYLPRTTESLEQLAVPVPEGFTRVEPPLDPC